VLSRPNYFISTSANFDYCSLAQPTPADCQCQVFFRCGQLCVLEHVLCISLNFLVIIYLIVNVYAYVNDLYDSVVNVTCIFKTRLFDTGLNS